MANFVLVTGFGTGSRTARRVGEAFAEVLGGECRSYTYGYAETHPEEVAEAVEGASLCCGHSQGNELLLSHGPRELIAVAPPISSGSIRMMLRMPLASAEFARHLFETNRLEIVASGIGEVMTNGFAHSAAFRRRHLGAHMLHKMIKIAQAGTPTTVVQMSRDELIPVLGQDVLGELPKLRHTVVDGNHNLVLTDPESVFGQVAPSRVA